MKRTCLLALLLCAGLISRAQKASLNHIALSVTDLQQSTSFYRDVIGLDTIPEPFHDGKHTWFRVGPKAHLHLIQGGDAPTEHPKNTHLCFSVASVPEFLLVLQKHRITYENWAGEKNAVTTRVDGVKQVYFRDPNGYWIEINEARE